MFKMLRAVKTIRIMGIRLHPESPKEESYITHYYANGILHEKSHLIFWLDLMARFPQAIFVYVGSSDTEVQIAEDRIRGRYLKSEPKEGITDSLLELPRY